MKKRKKTFRPCDQCQDPYPLTRSNRRFCRAACRIAWWDRHTLSKSQPIGKYPRPANDFLFWAMVYAPEIRWTRRLAAALLDVTPKSAGEHLSLLRSRRLVEYAGENARREKLFQVITQSIRR